MTNTIEVREKQGKLSWFGLQPTMFIDYVTATQVI